MASDTILSNLFKVAQSEVDEILYFNDFSKELRENFNELTNDEYDEALVAINEQLKGGNKLMEYSSGRCSISSSIVSKAINTVEYSKQQSENCKINISDVVITSKIFSQMIERYENLSSDEKKALIDNYGNLSREQQRELEDANINELDKIAEKYDGTNIGNMAKNARDIARISQNVTEALNPEETNHLTNEEWNIYFKDVISQNIEFIAYFRSKYPNTSLENLPIQKINDLYSQFGLEISETFSNLVKKSEEGELSPEEEKSFEQIKKQLEQSRSRLQQFYREHPELAAKIESFSREGKTQSGDKTESEQSEERKYYESDTIVSIENLPEEVKVQFDLSQNEKAETQEEILSDLKKIASEYKLEEIDQDLVEQQVSEQDISNALAQYQEYFQDFDEEMIEAMSEMTPEEIIANIKDDFDDKQNEGEITEETRRALDAMLEGITNETKDILLDSQKREVFFEKIQSELMGQKDRGAITDSEITEMFERTSVDLQVAPFEPVREEDVMPPAFSIPTDIVTAIGNTEMDIVYLNRNEPLEVDEGATRAANEALEKGEDVEEAISKYYREQQAEKASLSQEQTEEKSETEEEKSDSIPEIVVVDETEESIEQDNSLDGNSQMPEELTNESPVKDDADGKKNENFVVMKKGKDGKIQVLRPFQYSHNAPISFDQVIQEQKTLAQIIEAEKINGISGPVTEEQSQNNENNMNLENEDARE